MNAAAARRGRDTGSVTVEIAILGPALLLIVFTLVQTALWYHARALALAAAQQGAATAAAYGAYPGDGAAHAREFLARNNHDTLRDADITTTGSTATTVHLQVTGRALSVLPGVPGLTITQDAQAPVERFTRPGGTT